MFSQKIFLSYIVTMEVLFNSITLTRIMGIVFYFQELTSIDYSATTLNQEEDVDIIVHHILGVIDSFLRRNEQKYQTSTPETKQEELKALVSDAAKPFLTARIDRFVNEMELFLASGLNIEAYDEVYMQRLGWNTPGETGEGAEVEHNEQAPLIPYLFIFDEDSDGTD